MESPSERQTNGASTRLVKTLLLAAGAVALASGCGSNGESEPALDQPRSSMYSAELCDGIGKSNYQQLTQPELAWCFGTVKRS